MQNWTQVAIAIGGVIVIIATFVAFFVNKKVEKQRIEEKRENDKLIMALSYDPVIELKLIDNDKMNKFEFQLVNTGTSDIEITKIDEQYFYKKKHVGGTSEEPPYTYSDADTYLLKQNERYDFTLKFDDLTYNIDKQIDLIKENDKQGGPRFLKLTICYARINDRKKFEIIEPFVIAATVVEKFPCYTLVNLKNNIAMTRSYSEMIDEILK